MSKRKHNFIIIFIIILVIQLVSNLTDGLKNNYISVSPNMIQVRVNQDIILNIGQYIGITLAYLKPNWLPNYKGITFLNPPLYIKTLVLMIIIQLILSVILLFIKIYNLQLLIDFMTVVIQTYLMCHMFDNEPPDDKQGWRAKASRHFKEMMDRYNEKYPPQLAPVPA